MSILASLVVFLVFKNRKIWRQGWFHRDDETFCLPYGRGHSEKSLDTLGSDAS